MKSDNVFQNKNFVLTFLGAAVSNIGALFYSFAVGFWILELTNNNAVVQGAYLAVTGLTYVLFSPLGGVISDRHGKAHVMVVCDLLRGTLIFVASLLIFLVGNADFSVVVLFVVGVLGNVIGATFSPASTALLPHIAKEELLQQAISYFSVLNSFQSIVGGILAAILYAVLPVTVLFFVVAACYIVSGISEIFIRSESDKPCVSENASPLAELKEGFSYVLGSRVLRALVLLIVFINFFFAPVSENFFAYFLKTDVAGHEYMFSSLLSPEAWNSVFGICLSVASIIFAVILSAKPQKDRVGPSLRRWLFIVAALLFVMTGGYYLFVEMGLGLNAFLVLLCVGCFLLGMSLIFINVPVSTKIQLVVDKDKLGKVSSLLNMGSQGLIPVAVFLAGYALTYLGSTALLLICGLGTLAVAVASLFSKGISEI